MDTARLHAKIDFTDTCWLWRGALNSGYGIANIDGRTMRVHRVMYQLLVGPIPEGLDLDHLCRQRACCNPTHLEPVTRRENLSRGDTNVDRTHCRRGHEYTEENTYRWRDRRRCRACDRARHQRDWARHKQFREQ